MKFSDVIDLFIPRTCAGCGCETVTLCANCVNALDTPPVATMPRFGTVPAFGAGQYAGVLRQVVVNYKEHDRRDVAPVLGLMLARAVVAALEAGPMSATPVLLVPVPARAAAQRKRGANHVEVIARIACEQIARDGLPIRVADVLAVSGRGDQVGSGTRGRQANVRGTHRVIHAEVVARWPGRVRVIVVDDIVTTGATVAESARALRKLGVEVEAIASIGITGVKDSNVDENAE